jgi:serine O-acetyltransferase
MSAAGRQAAQTRQSMFSLLRADLRAKADWMYGDTSRRAIVKTLLTDGTSAMIVYRLMQAAHRHRLGLLAMVFNKLNVMGGCIIGRGADFGPGFVLIHSMGVVINGAVRGGSNVKIEHQVTIGAERNQSPTLGDDVFLGAGAKVIGAISIGSGARVGANAVVIADVPDGATAVGVPARNILREPRT